MFVLQMMNKVFGGTVHKKSVREDGVFSIALDNTCSLFRYWSGLICPFEVFLFSICIGFNLFHTLYSLGVDETYQF